jgi:hypothetical protein
MHDANSSRLLTNQLNRIENKDFAKYILGWREIHDFLKSTDASSLKVKINVYWPRSEDIGSKFHLFPLQLLVRSDPPPGHFLCNLQNLISLQLVKLIYGKWLKLIAKTYYYKHLQILWITFFIQSPVFLKLNKILKN